MRGISLIGVLLIVAGVAGLLIGHFSYSKTEKVAEIGPVEINKTEDHTVSIPTVAGIIVVLAGVGMVVAGARKA